MNYTDIKAFDYHPSVSTMLIDHWRHTSAEDIRAELTAIKARHPKFNTVRFTHSHEAWQRSPKQYCQRFNELLDIAASLGWQVISCLFNRWHDPAFDCGGTYLEQLIPDFSWAYAEGWYERFLQDVCLEHSADQRILLWETCNKPLGVYTSEADDTVMASVYEKRWLRELYCYIKKCEIPQPVGISCREDHSAETLSLLQHCADVMLISPYYVNDALSRKINAWDPSAISLPVLRVAALTD